MKAICPACNNCSQMGWHKATISPLITIPCDSCGTELTVSWKSYLHTVLPASLWFLIGYLLTEESSIEQYLVIGSSIVLMTLCQLLFLPLDATATDNS